MYSAKKQPQSSKLRESQVQNKIENMKLNFDLLENRLEKDR